MESESNSSINSGTISLPEVQDRTGNGGAVAGTSGAEHGATAANLTECAVEQPM